MPTESNHLIVERLLSHFSQAQRLRLGSSEQLWDWLCAAHIAGQNVLVLHARTHMTMLKLALKERDGGEAFGQLFRLCMVPLGHLLGRLPAGNSGRANIHALKPMPVEPRWKKLIDDAAYDVAQAQNQPR